MSLDQLSPCSRENRMLSHLLPISQLYHRWESFSPHPPSPVLANIKKIWCSLVTCLALESIIHDQKESLLKLEQLDFIIIMKEARNYFKTWKNQENYMSGEQEAAFSRRREAHSNETSRILEENRNGLYFREHKSEVCFLLEAGEATSISLKCL